MNFYSYQFLFIFLTITLLGYHLIGKKKYGRLAIVWLVTASLLFYWLNNPFYVILIICSIAFNYAIGIILTNQKASNHQKLIVISGITINILLLGYYKYANFFIDNANAIFNGDFSLNIIILPLGISFFSIQQIAYLVDTYRGEIGKHNFIDYCLFIAFFPKLISGPIVRFKEMMPQVVTNRMPNITKENVTVGLTALILGLFKKVVLADSFGVYADPVFNAAATGNAVSFVDSWIGALSYTFQLYFDFSGYSDMAIGLGLMFGIRLPLNFYSPYKATSIIDFWRRWHITLSRFIQDYLYIPLGGNRKGFPRQVINLLVAMAIAGFWHGAGWTFIVWGALHGLYLAINHSWRRLKRKMGWDLKSSTAWRTVISILVTFIALTVAWVFFRADTLSTATVILKGMIGMNGSVLPHTLYNALGVMKTLSFVIWLTASIVICWFLPNVQEYLSNYKPTLDSFVDEGKKYHSWERWAPSFWRAVIVAAMATLAILGLTNVSEFIYVQF
ncbi:MBOAT family O-acyltransferase [Chloroflexota bacterium]